MVPVDHCRNTGPLPGLEEYARYGGLFDPEAIPEAIVPAPDSPEQFELPVGVPDDANLLRGRPIRRGLDGLPR